MASLKSKYAILILAAGASKRLGRPKQLLMYKGKTLIGHTIEKALNSLCKKIYVVLGSSATEIEHELSGFPIQKLFNSSWERGMGSSVSTGVQAIEKSSKIAGVLILLCDQPQINPNLINEILITADNTQKGIVASMYDQSPAVPALFKRKYFKVLKQLSADKGAKHLMKSHPEDVDLIDFPEGSIDVDTWEDYQNL